MWWLRGRKVLTVGKGVDGCRIISFEDGVAIERAKRSCGSFRRTRENDVVACRTSGLVWFFLFGCAERPVYMAFSKRIFADGSSRPQSPVPAHQYLLRSVLEIWSDVRTRRRASATRTDTMCTENGSCACLATAARWEGEH